MGNIFVGPSYPTAGKQFGKIEFGAPESKELSREQRQRVREETKMTAELEAKKYNHDIWAMITDVKLPTSRAGARQKTQLGSDIMIDALAEAAKEAKANICYAQIELSTQVHPSRTQAEARVDYKIVVDADNAKWLTAENCDHRFTFVYLYSRFHANALVIDHRLKFIEHFEPHGEGAAIVQTPEKYARGVKTAIEEFRQTYLPDYKLVPFHEICPNLGPQSHEFPGKWERLGVEQKAGFCVAWSGMFIHLRMLNPNIPGKHIGEFMNMAGMDPLVVGEKLRSLKTTDEKYDWISQQNYDRIAKYVVWAEEHSPIFKKGVAEWVRDRPPEGEFVQREFRRGRGGTAMITVAPGYGNYYVLEGRKIPKRRHVLPAPRLS